MLAIAAFCENQSTSTSSPPVISMFYRSILDACMFTAFDATGSSLQRSSMDVLMRRESEFSAASLARSSSSGSADGGPPSPRRASSLVSVLFARVSCRKHSSLSLFGSVALLLSFICRRVPKFPPYGSVCCACAQRPGLPRACHSG
jgi:hypothetical protein